MAVQSLYDVGERMHLLAGVSAFALIGVILIALLPTQMKSMGRDKAFPKIESARTSASSGLVSSVILGVLCV